MKASELREKTVDELQHREQELAEQLFALRLQKTTGQLEKPAKMRTCAQGSGARPDGLEREEARSMTMTDQPKPERGRRQVKVGTVVSNKMNETVVVEVRRPCCTVSTCAT
jgi:ribosomal protein L29